MTSETTQLILNIDAGPKADYTELEQLTIQLNKELLELEVKSVDFVTKKAPEHTKAVEYVVLGKLIIAISSSRVLVEIIKLLRDIVKRYDGATVNVKIDSDEVTVEGKPSKEQMEIIDHFIMRHT
ncbi:hypothetical protein [Methanosarcina sp.]|uniref:hypothetical protein n=1 Tax=Methanosarcina sp. TaxID=2213 RepID=UPI002988E4A1|nr:hypothetical protein [Methanosarcina sp.]MDW5552288.1 hypothetical protein [Methanosarcina sp.]